MITYLACWVEAAAALCSQALAGEPQLAEGTSAEFAEGCFGFTSTFEGDWKGSFTVFLDRALLDVPLLGEGLDQKQAWGELLREVADAAAGDLLARSGQKCRLEDFVEVPGEPPHAKGRAFVLKTPEHTWTVQVYDALSALPSDKAERTDNGLNAAPSPAERSKGLDLLLDVELEATLRFGCRELPLGEVLDLGPGDVVQLDRTVRDPVDLVVGDKIVARGEVVLVNGNLGLRVTEVAAPRMRLESIRCLF